MLPRKPITVLYLAWALGMLMTAGFGLVTSIWQAMVVAFVAEGSITVLVVVWYTLLQRLVPSRLLGRVASLDWLISAAGVPRLVRDRRAARRRDRRRADPDRGRHRGCGGHARFMFVPGARDPSETAVSRSSNVPRSRVRAA